MNLVRISAVLPLNAFAVSFRATWLVVLGTFLLATVMQPPVYAITISIEHTPENENPLWDSTGAILTSHFQAAIAIWQQLLPGPGDFEFDYHWDDDISGLGLATPLGPFDNFIEINPTAMWFADATPDDHAEFSFAPKVVMDQTLPSQRIYADLSSADRTANFPGTTAPPDALETMYRGFGSASFPSLQPGINAETGNDLLRTVVHEIGHILGISGIEPGDYNLFPGHIGGLDGVLVKDGDGGHLSGTNNVPGFLMCDSCGVAGRRVLPSATDVLVIAEDQGISDVHLARVGRISSGVWGDSTAWIGGDVPDLSQDVYIRNAGAVSLDDDAEAKDLLVTIGNSVAVQNHRLTANGTLTFTGAPVSVGAGGTIAANNIVGDPVTLTTAAGSLVRFNQFTETAATSATFGGSVAIGFDTDPLGLITPPTTTVNPTSATWNIAENLTIGDENFANLIVDNGVWTVNGNVALGRVITATGGGFGGSVTLQNGAAMTVGGNVTVEGPGAAVIVEGKATLGITGNVTIGKGGGFTYRDDRSAPSRPYSIAGGEAVNFDGELLRGSGGRLTFEDASNAADATITLDGGVGDNVAGAQVTFQGNSAASTADFRTKGGHFGPSLGGFSMQGKGGQVRFEGTSGASTATFINEGCQDPTPALAFVGGTGGRTVFTDNSSAQQGTFHNHGATNVFVSGHPLGGATHFFNSSTAASANITNHADATFVYAGMEAKTVFYNSSDARNATIENLGAAVASYLPGQTEFRGNSSAASSNIHNRAHPTPGGPAGRTIFYDSASAANATIHTYEGHSDHGRVEFRNQSKAGRARIIVENVPSVANNGGYVNFYDNSSAEQSQIFLRAGTCCGGGISFNNSATAGDAQILTEDNSGHITFQGNSTAGDPVNGPTPEKANISLGQGSVMSFSDHSNAEDATITLNHGAQVHFLNHSSAGQAHISAWAGTGITFNSTSTVNDTTITLGGGTVPFGAGATAAFIGGAHAGTATITANGGTGGGGGAKITFDGGAQGDTARLIANAGATVDFLGQRLYGNGDTSVGSIEGAGTYMLRGSHLITGSRNLNTTVSGPLTDAGASGGRLTKVGTGTLTLAGANSYSGVTTVNEGTLSVAGSIAGGAVINSGGTLNGTGTIGGTVTVNSSGVFAPGTSPGTITVGGLSMNTGSTLNFELGDPLRDHIVLTNSGNIALAGTLNVLLLGGFIPTLGQSFSLFEGAVGSITGAFDSIIAPTFNGLTFDVIQNSNSILLQVGDAPLLSGDYNQNGTVDAPDYTLWRNNLGSGTLLANDDTPGVGPDDYDRWKAHFGETSASGSGASRNVAVPEPATLVLLMFVAAGTCLWRRRAE